MRYFATSGVGSGPRLVVFFGLLAALLLGEFAVAQSSWRRFRQVEPPLAGQLAYDSVRNRLVTFGLTPFLQQETWEWDGRWVERAPATPPSNRGNSSMAFDPVRREVILFGGQQLYPGNYMDDTWSYDGQSWAQRSPANAPSPRSSAALCEDRARGTMLLFGGQVGSGGLDDTWEWDGTNWTQKIPATTRPNAYLDVAMTFTNSGNVLLYGSSPTGPGFWQWDGADWSQLTPATIPNAAGAMSDLSMATDPTTGRVLLIGTTGGSDLETWEWDSVNWTLRETFPWVQRRGTQLAFHSGLGRFVLFGGDTPATSDPVVANVFTWNGATWERRSPAQYVPPMDGHAAAFDVARGETVLIGTTDDDTWTLRGNTWTHRTVTPHPTARTGGAAAYDATRQRVILFGGLTGAAMQHNNETWAWDGQAWTLLAPTNSPPARFGHGMTFDSIRGVVVMAGGFGLGGVRLTDSWEWDGSDWSQRSGSAPGLGEVTLAYDAFRRRTVLVSGQAPVEIWEWDGQSWSSRFSASGFSTERGLRAAYDPIEQLVFVYAPDPGLPFNTPATERVYAWNGFDLRELLNVADTPTIRFGASMHFDPLQGGVLVFGGRGRNVPSYGQIGQMAPDVFVYQPDDPSFVDVVGQGCGANGAAPLGLSTGTATVSPGSTFAMSVDNLPAGSSAVTGLVGFSAANAGSVALPTALDVLGATGCTLYTSVNSTVGLGAGSVGSIPWSLTVPNASGLLDLTFFTQAAAGAPGANPLGLTLSNALAVRVGR